MKAFVAVLLIVLGIASIEASCGIRPAGSRVINGQNASPHAWPWQISLRKNGGHICGGTIISPTWIVTAAHCIHSNKNPSSYTIVAGAHKKYGSTPVQQTLRVAKIIEHPKYNQRRIVNDIALLQLFSPIKMSDKVGAACLTESRPSPGKRCYITGWGNTNGIGGSPKVLQQAAMPIQSQERCRKHHSNVNSFAHICAGEGRFGAPGGCNGDSGGPLVCEDVGRWYLHGAVSFGKIFCPTNYYTVFARVSSYINWIKENTGVGPEEGKPTPSPTQEPPQTPTLTGVPPSTPIPTGGPPPPSPTTQGSSPPPTQGPTAAPSGCRDISSRCQQYKHKCGYNSYVRERCQKTCGLCCKDSSDLFCKLNFWQCGFNANIKTKCPKTCKQC